MKKELYYQKHGQTLIIVIFVLIMILAMVAGFAVLVINEIKIQKGLSNSACAYYAAETGVEKGILQVRNGIFTGEPLTTMPENNCKYSYTINEEDFTPNVGGNIKVEKITSTGFDSQGKVIRKIEAKIKKILVVGDNIYWPLRWREITP